MSRERERIKAIKGKETANIKEEKDHQIRRKQWNKSMKIEKKKDEKERKNIEDNERI